jgi:hypothetical protein
MQMPWTTQQLLALEVLIETGCLVVEKPTTKTCRARGVSLSLTKVVRQKVQADVTLMGKIQKLNRQYKRKLAEATEDLR